MIEVDEMIIEEPSTDSLNNLEGSSTQALATESLPEYTRTEFPALVYISN